MVSLTDDLNQNDLVSRTRDLKIGLESLREEHTNILNRLNNEEYVDDETKIVEDIFCDDLLCERIEFVTNSLQQLDFGVAESGVLLSLSSHFNQIEAEKMISRMEMKRIKVRII